MALGSDHPHTINIVPLRRYLLLRGLATGGDDVLDIVEQRDGAVTITRPGREGITVPADMLEMLQSVLRIFQRRGAPLVVPAGGAADSANVATPPTEPIAFSGGGGGGGLNARTGPASDRDPIPPRETVHAEIDGTITVTLNIPPRS